MHDSARGLGAQFSRSVDGPHVWVRCPYGRRGDLLWVRETHAAEADRIVYRADRSAFHTRTFQGKPGYYGDLFYLPSDYQPERWSSGVGMPRWASRLTLTILSVRVERLQEISEADAWAEGVEMLGGVLDTPSIARAAWDHGWTLEDPRAWFCAYWRLRHGEASQEANPWVWCLSFCAYFQIFV